jgi:hypothetical protein
MDIAINIGQKLLSSVCPIYTVDDVLQDVGIMAECMKLSRDTLIDVIQSSDIARSLSIRRQSPYVTMDEAIERYGIKPSHLASIKFNKEMLYSSKDIRMNMRQRFGYPEEWLKSIIKNANNQEPDTRYLHLFLPVSPMASVQQICDFYKSSVYYVAIARDDPEICQKYMEIRRSTISLGVHNQAELDFDMVLDEIGEGTETLKFSCIFCQQCDELVDILYGKPCQNFGVSAHRRARLLDYEVIPNDLLQKAADFIMTGSNHQIVAELLERHRECCQLKAKKLGLEPWVGDLSEYEDEDLEQVINESYLVEQIHDLMDDEGLQLVFQRTQAGVLCVPVVVIDLVDKWSEGRSIHCLNCEWTREYVNQLYRQFQRPEGGQSDLLNCVENARQVMNRVDRLIECVHESSKITWEDCALFSDMVRNYVVNGSFCDSLHFGGPDTDGAIEVLFAIRVFRDAVKDM